MIRPRATLVPLVVATALLGCADIDAWDIEECGNNVVEPDEDEDCDLVADPALGDDLQCGPPDGGPEQCRYLCDGADCPRGWTCGDDGICRAPSGEFEVDDEPRVVAAAQQIALRNVFGEDESELVARLDGDVVVYGSDDEGFRPQAELTIPGARGELSFADIDDDDRFDILVPAASVDFEASAQPRVHALRDDGDRLVTAVVPQRPSASSIANVVGVEVGDAGAEVLLRVVRDDAGMLAAEVEPSNCASAVADARVDLPIPASGIVPPPPTQPAFAAGTRQVAVASVGSAVVAIVGVERTCGPAVCEPAYAAAQPCATHLTLLSTVTMPAAIAAPGCRFLDLDATLGADLVCHLDGDVFGVALDDGTAPAAPVDGSTETETETWFAGLDALPAGQSHACAPTHRILAVADLDGDGRSDLVTPHGLFRADAAGGWVRMYARTLGDGWAEAAVGDFDRDGRPDVVASVQQAADGCAAGRLQALVETDGAYASRIVRDAALPSNLRTGDFDGDGIDDVALVEPRGDEAWVTVSFGDTKEALQDTVSVGGFSDVSALAGVRSREGAEINEDLVGDLAIVSEGGDFVTLVLGTTTRSLLSPLVLSSSASDGTAPAVVLAGSLVPRDPAVALDELTPDVLTLRGSTAWLLRDQDVHHGDYPLVVADDPLGIRVACSTWTTAAERGEGGSAFAGIDGHATRIGGAPHGCDLDATPRLVVARFGGTRAAPVLQTALASAPGTLRRPTGLAWLDLDGAGEDDLLVHFAFDGATRRGSLAWVRDADPGTTPTMVPLAPELDVLAATPIDADADPGIEIAILTAEGLRILDATVDPQGDGTPTIVALDPVFEAPRLPVGDELVRLVAGDVDGNEIADLALLVADAIYIYPAIERD